MNNYQEDVGHTSFLVLKICSNECEDIKD